MNNIDDHIDLGKYFEPNSRLTVSLGGRKITLDDHIDTNDHMYKRHMQVANNSDVFNKFMRLKFAAQRLAASIGYRGIKIKEKYCE